MSTKTSILAGKRIWETWVLVPVRQFPRSVDTTVSCPHPRPPFTSSSCYLWDRCASPSAILRENTLYVEIWRPAPTPESHSGPRSLRQALLSTDWLKCTWHLILKVHKCFNIQKLFFARVKLNNSYYVYKIPSMKNKGLSELIKKEVLQKL